MKRVGLIGCGAIGTAIIDAWATLPAGNLQLTAVLGRRRNLTPLPRKICGAEVMTSIVSFMETRPEIVIEAASHEAVVAHGAAILAEGCEFHVFSIGALADEALRDQLLGCAQRSGGKIVIPAGALAGLDGLRSMKASGLEHVKYTCIKPPAAWRSTVAEEQIDLDRLETARCVFHGSARSAARAYPRNANLAAAVAFAGLGLDHTEVELIADPYTHENIAHIQAYTANDRLHVTLSGAGFTSNPKSSQITAMSAIAALNSKTEALCFA
jgi:aspartate dehydrogenase